MAKLSLTHVITSVNDNPKYLKFIPLFIAAWRKFFPHIIPIIVYVGNSPLSEQLTEYKQHIVAINIDTAINSVFASQVMRLLYTCILKPDDVPVITDIDMIPTNSCYFREILTENESDFISFRPQRSVGKGQVAMCYLAARTSTWIDIFNIHSLEDIHLFLQKYRNGNFDGVHGGTGWFTDQLLMYNHLMEWKDRGNTVVFKEDSQMGYNRLDFYHHRYSKDLFIALFNSGSYSDAHLYADMCIWNCEDIHQLASSI